MADKRLKDLGTTATESDLVAGNFVLLDGTDGTKKLKADSIAGASDLKSIENDVENLSKALGLANADFSIEDENGNSVFAVIKGFPKTKKFNITENIGGYCESDFSIEDENGNAIFSIENGFPKTKKFDGSNVSKKIKILSIGNSFSIDSLSYTPFILKGCGCNVKIGLCYKASNYIEQENNEYESGNGYSLYTCDNTIDDAWKGGSVSGIKECVSSDEWDLILFQQSNAYAGDYESYSLLSSLMKKVITDCKKTPAFGMLVIHCGYADNSSQYISVMKRVYEENPFVITLPYGTAMANSVSSGMFSSYSQIWAPDGLHLNEGLPCYVAAVANAEAIIEYFFRKGSVVNDKIRPTQEWINARNVQNQQGTSWGVTDENCINAQFNAVMTNKHPFTKIQ